MTNDLKKTSLQGNKPRQNQAISENKVQSTTRK